MSAIDDALTILQTQTGIQDSMSSNDPATTLNNLGQIAAGLSTLATKYSPILAIDTNLIAALTTIEKMQLNYNSRQSPSIEDYLSLAGNVFRRIKGSASH